MRPRAHHARRVGRVTAQLRRRAGDLGVADDAARTAGEEHGARHRTVERCATRGTKVEMSSSARAPQSATGSAARGSIDLAFMPPVCSAAVVAPLVAVAAAGAGTTEGTGANMDGGLPATAQGELVGRARRKVASRRLARAPTRRLVPPARAAGRRRFLGLGELDDSCSGGSIGRRVVQRGRRWPGTQWLTHLDRLRQARGWPSGRLILIFCPLQVLIQRL